MNMINSYKKINKKFCKSILKKIKNCSKYSVYVNKINV